MALDIIARAAAASAKSDAATALARAASLDLFSNLPAKSFGASVSSLLTAGYAAAGAGSALYVADTAANAALASAHPRFCKADATGRYFRLAGDCVSVEQGGAAGTAGINDQPAIQAALNYAAAVGIRRVTFGKSAYELWAPDYRAQNWGTFVETFLNVPACSEIELCGAAGGTTLTQKGYAGGSIAVQTQTTADAVTWRGHMLSAIAAVGRLTLRGLIFDGTSDYAFGTGNTGADLTNKGLVLALDNVNELYVHDCTMKRFKGEVFYIGGSVKPSLVHVENLILRDSPQALWNPGGLGKVVAINLDCENSYQPAEVIGGMGHTYIGGRFAKGNTNTFLGLSQFTGGYPYWWPARDTTKTPPWMTFVGTRFEAAGPTQLSSWARGNIVTVDTTLNVAAFAGQDIYLDVEAWVDQGSGSAAVEVGGPATTTTQVPSAPVGVYYPKLQNVAVKVRCFRTAAAKAANRSIDGIKFGNGLMDKQSCIFEVEGAARNSWLVNGAPVAGFELPLVTIGKIDNLNLAYGAGLFATGVTAGSTTALDVLAPAYSLDPNAAGTALVTLNTAFAYKQGQRVIFVHANNNSGRLVQFQAGGAGLALKQSRTLYAQGDLLELEYSEFSGKWHEVRYMTRQAGAQFIAPIVLTDAATVTPDFGKGTDFEWAIGGNRTLANPANAIAGQTGTIRITQDVTGGRTMASGTNWRWPGGKAAGGVLSTAAGAVDVIRYTVGSDGLILARLDKAMAV